MVGVAPAVLAAAVERVSRAVGDAQLTEMFRASMATNLTSVAETRPDGCTFMVTGDIPAMWLRDSAAQLRPYLLLCRDDPALADVLIGVLRQQLAFIVVDPYANAFNRDGDRAGHRGDRTHMDRRVWERKYEVDSLCYPLELAYRLWRVTGRTDFLAEGFRAAAVAILDLWEVELDHERRSPYRFERLFHPASDTLTRSGRGPRSSPTGMTWSGFRPSDDSCRFSFNVPGNMFAAVVLGYLVEISQQVLHDPELADRAGVLARGIRAGIEQHGVVEHPDLGRVFAYEVDGRGGVLLMDDANMPSLLSIPLTGFAVADDPTYLATRRLILSGSNPYYFAGSRAAGIGSPHTPHRHVWPIALAVQGLTATDEGEKRQLLNHLRDTDAGTGRMHESFHCDDPRRFTRPWFSWADAMFCELALDVAGLRFSLSSSWSAT